MKILLVDDHALFRAGLRMLLGVLGKDIVVVEASTADEASRAVETDNAVDLCLLDLSLKSGDGFQLLQELKTRAPMLAIVVVSGADDGETIRRCIDAGAMSFIAKSSPPEALTDALRQVLSGEVHLPDQIKSAGVADTKPALTPRQREVLKYLSRGWPTKLIAREMNLSEYTIKEHIALIFQALRVRNRTEAVISASRLVPEAT